MGSSERRKVSSASLDDLDLEAAQDWVEEHAPGMLGSEDALEDALESLQLVDSVGKRRVPTTAGLYVFGKRPQWHLPQLGVVAARISGMSLSDDVEVRTDLEGPLDQLVDGVLEFVGSHSRQLVNQVAPDESELEFPMAAVREAIVNALVHRDLKAGGQVSVRIFEDRLEIWSPGSSALSDDIGSYLRAGGVSVTRNPLIALLARKMGLVEQMGRGLPTIRRLVEKRIQGEVTAEDSREDVLVTIPSGLHTHPAHDFERTN